MTYVGIDVGLGGAIAGIYGDGAWVVPMPTLGTKQRKTLDLGEIASSLVYEQRFVCLEEVSPGPKMGKAQCMRLGQSQAYIVGMLVATGIPYQIVKPRIWQKEMLTANIRGDTKRAAIAAAKALFPGVSLKRTERCTKDDDGMADALLLAEFARRLRA